MHNELIGAKGGCVGHTPDSAREEFSRQKRSKRVVQMIPMTPPINKEDADVIASPPVAKSIATGEHKFPTLFDLKAGDKVNYMSQYSKRIEIIKKVTTQMIFIQINEKHEERFWKKDGYVVGGSSGWYLRERIAPYTKAFEDEIILRNQAKELREIFEKANLLKVGIEGMEQIKNILEGKNEK